MFEVPVLAIVSEVYDRNVQSGAGLAEGRRRLREKIDDECGVRPRVSVSPTTGRAGAFRARGTTRCCAR
jgi:hypothetical protein